VRLHLLSSYPAMTEIPRRSTLVSQVVEILRHDIDRGQQGGNLLSERMLCERFQVSRITVRAALDVLRREGLVAVAKGRRTRILPRRRLHEITRPSKVIALLAGMPYHWLSAFSLYLISVLQGHLRDAGYQLEVHARERFGGRHWAHELEALVGQTRASCWVLYGGTIEAERWFAERKIRAMGIGSPTEGADLPCLGADYQPVSRHAVGMLLSKGHNRVAMVSVGPNDSQSNPAAKGFLEGFPSGAERETARSFLFLHDGSVPGVCSVVRTLFRSKAPPTGLIVARPKHALTVITYLHSIGWRVPQDVSVISLGYDPFLDNVVPAITHYEMNWPSFARRLFRMVMRLATVGNLPRRPVLVMPEFRLGGTLSPKS
jgi:DNA-binding LacI/PurR family transcriptional regulator